MLSEQGMLQSQVTRPTNAGRLKNQGHRRQKVFLLSWHILAHGHQVLHTNQPTYTPDHSMLAGKT
jgi:hypothetical protein